MRYGAASCAAVRLGHEECNLRSEARRVSLRRGLAWSSEGVRNANLWSEVWFAVAEQAADWQVWARA